MMLQRILTWLKREWIIVALFVGFTVLYSVYSIVRHVNFQSGYDLGIFNQAMWLYSHFLEPYITVHQRFILGEHFHPILILFVPIYWLSPRAETLLVIQAAAVSAAIFPIYYFSRSRLGQIPAYLVSVAAISYWGLQIGAAFDFHEVAIAVPLIAGMIWALDAKRWTYYWIFLAGVLLCKEDLSLLIAATGLVLLVKKEWWKGLLTTGIGIGWFFLLTKTIMPYFAGNAYGFWSYNNIAPDLPSAVRVLIKDPNFIYQTFITPEVKLHTLIFTFAGALYLFLFSPYLIMMVPLLAERFLSGIDSYWIVNYHYTMTLAPVIAMAAIDGIYTIGKALGKVRPKLKVAFWWVGATSFIAASIFITLEKGMPLSAFTRRAIYRYALHPFKGGPEALSRIPKDAVVAAQDALIPHLSSREKIYELLDPTADPDYYIVNYELAAWPYFPDQIAKHMLDEQNNGYVSIYKVDNWEILKKQ